MFNVLGTMLVLNQSTETAQKAAEARFGKQLQLVVGESHQLAVSDQRDAITVNTQQQERPLVMAADFGILGTAQGYLKLVGNFPAARIDFSGWGKSGKVDALTKVVNELPQKDPRFLIQKGAMAEAEWAHGILGNYPSQRLRQEPQHELAQEVESDPEVADFDQPKTPEQDRRPRKLDVDLGDDLPI